MFTTIIVCTYGTLKISRKSEKFLRFFITIHVFGGSRYAGIDFFGKHLHLVVDKLLPKKVHVQKLIRLM